VTEPEHLLHRLKMRDVEESAERLVIDTDNRPDLVNIRGAIQGGLVATLIDIAAGRLAGENVRPDQSVTTADMTVHFLAPIIDGPARAVATIIRKASAPSSPVSRCLMWDATGSPRSRR
jgi:uncharacterized protein (TIGR00369 family)